jgi:CHAT domain-containing protein/tetratricopeptide (TPR) repeat protein
MRHRHLTLAETFASAVCLAPLASGSGAPPVQESARVLKAGETLIGEVLETSPRIQPAALEAPVPGVTVRIALEEPGPHYVELHSHAFDPYLVLLANGERSEAGDDDGAFAWHAQLALPEGVNEVALAACARHGRTGPFELIVLAGTPPQLTRSERQVAERDDSDRALAAASASGDPLESDARLEALLGFYLARDSRAEALHLASEIVRVREERGAPDASLAAGVHFLGRLLFTLGDHESAVVTFERARELRGELLGASHPDTLDSGYEVAATLHALGRGAEARPLIEANLAERERVLGAEHERCGDSQCLIGWLDYVEGNYRAALARFRRGLAINEVLHGPDHAANVNLLNNVANQLQELGEYAEALPLAERALALEESVSGPDDPAVALCLDLLAHLLIKVGDAARAFEAFERAEELVAESLGADHALAGPLAGGKALAARALGRFDEAEALYLRQLEITRATLAPDAADRAAPHRGLAELHEESGQLERAHEQWNAALEITEVALGPDHPHAAYARAGLARTLARLGQPEAARPLFEDALAILERAHGEGIHNTRAVRRELALTLADLGEVRAGWDLLEEAWGDARSQVAELRAIQSEEQMLQLATETRRNLEALVGLADALADNGARRRAFGAVLDWKGHVARELMTRRRTQWERGAHDAAAPERDDGTFERLAAALGRETAETALVDFLLVRPVRPGHRDEDGRLEHWGETHVRATLVVPGAERPVSVDLGPAEPIEAATRRFLAAVERAGVQRGVAPEHGPAATSSAASLRALVFDPLAAHLEDVELVVVSPDGFLGALPFGALQQDDGSYLLERFAFAYTQDPAALATGTTGGTTDPGGGTSLLAIGGVAYGEDAGEWTELPGTAIEVERVAALHREAFAGAEVLALSHTEPDEPRLRRELPRHAFAHLATHGFFRGDETLHPGLRSGIVLAGANTPARDAERDGILTAEEVRWMDLGGVELVVLSACETGLGRAHAGEGLLGLRRALHIAGADTVLSSLWPVPDEQTAQLMEAFYTNLWVRGLNRVESLRRAQLELLAESRGSQPDGRPAVLGAFVLSGRWR